MEVSPANEGTIAAVRGSVVDACFPGHIPPLYDVLEADDVGQALPPANGLVAKWLSKWSPISIGRPFAASR